MQFLALSGAQESSSFSGLFQYGEHRVLIDAGVRFDPPPGTSSRPQFALLDDAPPAAILLTHAHIDHVGSLPLLVEKFPDIPIFATQGTVALLRVLFFEGVRSQERDHVAMEKESFMFRPQWLRQILNRIQVLSFGESFQPIEGVSELTATYTPAGHLLGAGMIVLETPKGRVMFTGDCSVRTYRTIAGIDLKNVPQADILVCDARYGDSVHRTQEEQEERLIQQLDAVLRKKGRAIFPCFAVGRVQELILLCLEAQREGRLLKAPIYLDGSVRAASQVFIERQADLLPSCREQWMQDGASPFESAQLGVKQVGTTVERRRITRTHSQPFIVFSSSGFLEGGPSPLYVQSIASDRRSAVFLNALQDDEYPGPQIARCKQGDTIQLNNKRVTLDCQVIPYSLSTHLDAEDVRALVRAVQPSRLLLVQNESTSLVRLGRQCTHTDVTVPQPEQLISLSFEKSTRPKASQDEPESTKSKTPLPKSVSADYVPTVQELYESIKKLGGLGRVWTVREIAASFYKKSFQAQHRTIIKELLSFCEPYFIRQRHGSDWAYTPQEDAWVERQQKMLERVKALVPGDVVLVQQITAEQGPPRIAIVQKPFDKGSISLIAETWKAPKHNWKVVKLIPGIHDDEIDASSTLPDLRQTIDLWRDLVKEEAIDLVSLWRTCSSEPRTFDEWATQGHQRASSKLALGLELLHHGLLLWKHDGEFWTPRSNSDVRVDKDFLNRHATLMEAGEARVQHSDGRKGRLTRRVHWDSVEVLWDANASFTKEERIHIIDETDSGSFESILAPVQPITKPNVASASSNTPSATSTQASTTETVQSATPTNSVTVHSKAKTWDSSALQKLLKDEGVLRPRKDIRLMQREELIQHFGSKRSGRIVFARLFRSLVWQAYQWIQKGKEEPLKGGMQSFWYRWCLPALKKAPEYRNMKFEPYDLMCRTFTQMVFELGLFSYSDFGFVDLNQRNRLIGTTHPNILVFAEKALWYPLLAELHQEYGVSVIAFYGTPSSLTTEYTARELLMACGEETALHLIGIVSYSPAGDIASRSFQHQLTCAHVKIEDTRTVIHPQHYLAEEVELYKVPIPSRQKTKLTHWMEKTGGIHGEPYGLESESMPQDRLKGLIEQHIRELIKNA